jgi:O-antigen ligase
MDRDLSFATRGRKVPDMDEGGERWVDRLSVVVLAFTLLYVVFGIPGENRIDTSQTDRVSPLNSWIWLALLASAMPVLQRRWREVLALLKASWPLLALFFYFALSVTWALDPSASGRRLLFTLLQLFLFAILLSGIRTAPTLHVVVATVCGISALVDIVAWVVAPGYTMSDLGFQGLQSQKNETGLLMMYGCLAAFPCIFLVAGRAPKVLLAAATLTMGLLLVATRSTTSESVVMSAAFVMPMVLLIARLRQHIIWAITAGALMALATAGLIYLAWSGLSGTDPMLPLRGVTFTQRTDIWSFVVQQIHQRPWFGAGYSSFWAINPAIQPSLKTDQWFGVDIIINEAHDGYLDLLATGGVIGLVGGLLVFVRGLCIAGPAITRADAAEQSWKSGRLSRPTAAFHLSLLLGLLLHNFTESNLFSNNGLLAVAFLLCALDLEKWRISRLRKVLSFPPRHFSHAGKAASARAVVSRRAQNKPYAG